MALRSCYADLVGERLAAIAAHGDPARWADYFPRYLLKCMQDFFGRHGDELYHELEHVRHALETAQASLRFAEHAAVQSRQIAALTAAHRILQAGRPARSPTDPTQLALF